LVKRPRRDDADPEIAMHKRREVSRRTLIQCVFASAFGYTLESSQGPAPVDENYRDFASGDVPDLTLLGTEPALREEVRFADRILAGAPITAPLHVMEYLEQRIERNKDNELYNGGWRTRWNPVLVRFFEQTRTKPSGDTTPWCAACLNWSLGRSQLVTTNSASSGSFRNAPGVTSRPSPGDIVVFRSSNDELARVGRGHVGIFVDRSDREIIVLGGNQKNAAGHHSVCRRSFAERGRELILHSFHAMDAFKPQ
jgi:uncharacterized protein (TIGR02594 family)